MVFTLALGSNPAGETMVDLGDGLEVKTDIEFYVAIIQCLYPVNIAVSSDDYSQSCKIAYPGKLQKI